MRTAKKVVKEPEIKFHIGQMIPGNRKIVDIKFSPRQLLIETKITIYCILLQKGRESMKTHRKLLAMLLALVLCCTALPLSAFAVTPPLINRGTAQAM